MQLRSYAAILAGIALCAAKGALAVPGFTTHASLASFQAALGGAPTFTQDFESFANHTSLFGVPLVPGVTASTNGTTLEVFNSASVGNIMAGFARSGTEFYYDVNLANPYNAIAFDVQAFDPAAEHGRLDVFFADATSTSFNIDPGATESTPVFFGIVADAAISRVRWNEPAELNGLCCEETGLDNFVVAQAVPEPSSVLLLGLGLAGIAVGRWRRTMRVGERGSSHN